MSSAAWPLQTAVYARLSADLAPIAVYDIAPAAAPFPYVTVGEFTAADEYDKSDDAENVTLTLHVWSRKTGRKECKELLGRLRASLHGKDLPVAGHRPVTLRQQFTTDLIDPDGVTIHGVARFGGQISTN
jgi:Protein of unknown function (DUF3168)